MRVVLFASLLIACGTTTFTSEEGGTSSPDASMMSDGGMTWPGCTGSCVQIASVDSPTCLEGTTGSLFYATDGMTPTLGRIDKTSLASVTANLDSPAVDCTLYGSTMLIAATPGHISTFNAVTMMPGPVFGMGAANVRITSRFLGTQYVAGIRTDGLWGCDGAMPMPNCKTYQSVGALTGIATDGDFIYYGTDKGVFRNATNAAAIPELIVMAPTITALTLDGGNIVYATSMDKAIWSVGKTPGSVVKKLVDVGSTVRWVSTDVGGLYWSTIDRVSGSKKDGSSVVQYADRQSAVRVVADDTYVYWINHVPKMNGGGVFRMKK